MTLRSCTVALGALLLLALGLAPSAPARADDGAADAKKPTVLLDITEEVALPDDAHITLKKHWSAWAAHWRQQGEDVTIRKVEAGEQRDNIITYILRKHLREAGFEVESKRPTRWDKKKKKKKEEKEEKEPADDGAGEGDGASEGADDGAAEGGDEEPAAPSYDLTITGRVTATYAPSTFYEEIVAHVFKVEGHLVVTDASGAEVARIDELDKYGESKAKVDDKKPKRGTAYTSLKTCYSRMATWFFVELLNQDALTGRLGPELLAKIKPTHDKLSGVKAKSQDKGGAAAGGGK